MAEKRVSVRLVAEGGRHVRAELEGIGEAGSRGFGRLSAEMELANARLGSFARKARIAMAAVTVAAAAAGVAMIRSGLANVDAQAKLAQSMRTTVESVQTLTWAGELAGVSMGEIEQATKKLTTRLSEAATGSGSAVGALQRLNLTAQVSDMTHPLVGIIMGSQSDWPTMREAADILNALGVSYEAKIVSAHRTPDRLWTYGKTAVDRGLQVIIAGAGGAAHLPGMMASKTRVPVVGVPVQTRALSGVDSLYSILQMPRGYPVATMAIGAAGAANAGLMAAGILALQDPALAARLDTWRADLTASIADAPVDE